MMRYSWRSTIWAAIGFVVASTNAQPVQNLGKVLAKQSDLSTFYGLIQVCGFYLQFLVPKT